MHTMSRAQGPYVLSYLTLRRSVGIIGMALPLVLIFGKMILESPGILDSISLYYYSVMRDVFVGSLCAIAVFLFSYRYEIQDDIAGSLAGAFAIGVALFPIAPSVGATGRQVIIGWFHLLFAACFFSALAYFAIVLFRKTDQSDPPTRRKQLRNMIYLSCGIAIVACLVLIIVIQFLLGNSWLHLIFWLETLAIMAFGISWFVKGETILRDK